MAKREYCYCTCGDSMHLSGSPRLVEAAKRSWSVVHSGDGHSPCDPATARKARAAAERAEAAAAPREAR